MKLYQVLLRSNPPAEVVADTWMRVDGQIVFFANGSPIPDVFFMEDSVEGVNVIVENYEEASRPYGGGSY